jgi:hypothetical protein
MNATYPRAIFILAVLPLLLSMAHGAEQGPGLRQTNYLGLLTHAGEQVKLQLRSRQRSASYVDELNYVIVARDSHEIATGMVPLGTTKIIAFRASSAGLCVLEIEPGYNAAYVDPGATPHAYIASDTIPLRMVGPLSPAYFYVPDGCKRFTLHVTAEVAREAARIRIFSPTGQVVHDEEGEFDNSTAIKADVPPGQDNKVWSLSVEKPQTPGWHLDKVVLSLDPPLAPYLTRRADWALAFGTREHARPSRPDRPDSKRRSMDQDRGPSESASHRLHRATNALVPLTPQDGRTALPFSYILDYGPQHIRSPQYIETIGQAPPGLLHLGKDVPFTHNWGPIQALGGENQAYGKRRPYSKEDDIRRLSPAEVRQRISDLTQMVNDLHKAGVRWVAPYICNMTIAGRPDTRTGFWEFYDLGRQRRMPALGDILETAGGAEPAVRQIGAGRTAYAAVLPPAGMTLASWIAELASHPLVAIRADHPAELGKVRINAFRQPGQDRYIVHMLNYNVPLGVDPPELKPAGPIGVSLPVSDAARMKLRCYDPWGETADLPVAADGNSIRFTLPQLRVYKIVEIYRQ